MNGRLSARRIQKTSILLSPSTPPGDHRRGGADRRQAGVAPWLTEDVAQYQAS